MTSYVPGSLCVLFLFLYPHIFLSVGMILHVSWLGEFPLEGLGGTYFIFEYRTLHECSGYSVPVCEICMSLCQFCYFVFMSVVQVFCVCVAGAGCVCTFVVQDCTSHYLCWSLFSTRGLLVLLDILSLVGRGTGRAGVNHFLLYLILEGFLEEGGDPE